MSIQNLLKSFFTLTSIVLLAGCEISAEKQAIMDEFAATIPTCNSVPECQSKWDMARAWVQANADFGIRISNNERINSTATTFNDESGIGIDVTRVALNDGSFQILVDMECIRAYGCPDLWDKMVDFNQVVNAAR